MSPDRCHSHFSRAFLLLASVLLTAFASACDSPVTGKSCQVNGDCQAGFQCVSGHCKAAKGGTCAGGVEACTDGSECASGLCTSGCCAAVCATNEDCADGELCNAGVCESQAGTVDAGTDAGTTAPACDEESDCSGETPHCLLSTGSCVQCRSGADCSAISRCTGEFKCALRPGRCEFDTDCADTETPACDLDSNQCVQCTSDGNCPSGQSCGADLLCHVKQTGCTKDADCSAGNHCDLTDHQCHANQTGCTKDMDCSSNAAAPFCDTTTATCVACNTDMQCGGTKKCQSHTCVVTGCTSDTDCSSMSTTPRCNVASGTCVACNTTPDCGAANKVCQNNVCVTTGCLTDSDCTSSASGSHCNTSNSQCVKCLNDTHCSAAQMCQANQCVMRTCAADADCANVPNATHCKAASSSCVQCTSDTHCASGQTCQNNACVATVPATPCAKAADCTSSQSCDVDYNSTNTGFVASCQPATTGFGEGGDSCQADSECRSGYCLIFGYAPTDGICVSACKPASALNDCGYDAVCPTYGVGLYMPGPNGVYESTATGSDDVWASAPICWPPTCSTDDDCWFLSADSSKERACMPWVDVLDPGSSTKVTLYCMPAEGDVYSGDPCTSDEDCASDWCVTWVNNNNGHQKNGCFGACTSDWDCWGSDICVNTSLRQNGQVVKSCAPQIP